MEALLGIKPIHLVVRQIRKELSLAGPTEVSIAINDAGQIAGKRHVKDTSITVRTEPNQPIQAETESLGALGSSGYSEPPFAAARDINAQGQVVGRSTHGGSGGYHAFRTAPNQPINPATDDLGTLGGADSQAFAVNDKGQVTGIAQTSDLHEHAFRTAPNRPINPVTDDLGSFGLISYGYAINNAGQVAGWSDTANGERHAFRTAPNRPINPATDDLGTLGGRESYGWGINNAGYVVGRSLLPGTLAVGHRMVSNLSVPLVWRAFVHDGKRLLDLNTLISPTSGWFLYEAKDINDRGQIIGNGICPEGKLHGFLLTPVPEPGQLVLLGLTSALCGLGFVWLHSRAGV